MTEARTDLTAVQRAYASWAPAYIDLFDGAEKADEQDRALITAWGRTVTGPVLDAGCGPGHWAAHLHADGVAVEGVDATAEFVEHARRAHPGVPFREGDLRRLDLPAGSLGGVLAWFSLIHLAPDEVRAVLGSLGSALRPGGTLLLGCFTGPALAPFDHRVATAWAWPRSAIEEAVTAAGLAVGSSGERVQPNGRVVAHLVARRPG